MPYTKTKPSVHVAYMNVAIALIVEAALTQSYPCRTLRTFLQTEPHEHTAR